MDAFWSLARRMLRYRVMVAMALLFAIVSAGGLTAGLIGVGPVLGNILGTEGSQGLRDLAQSANQARFWPGWIDWRIPQHWIDALPTGRFTAVVVLVIGLGLLTLIGGAANFLHAFLSLTVVQRSVADIRREAFHRSVRLPLKELVGQGTQDKVSRIINDTWQLESGFTSLLSKAVSQVLKGLGALAAALIVEWRLTIAALLLAPVLYTVIRRLGKRVRRASRAAYTSTGQLMTAATEALQGLRVVKVHTTERYEAGRFHRINKDVMRQMLRARTAKALSSPLVEVLAIIVLGGLSLIAAKAIIDGKLEVDRFIVALAALFAAGASLKPLTGLLNDIQASSAAASRIREVLEAPPEPGHGKSLPRLARHAVSIEFHNVTFTYPGAARPALDRVSLRVDHGQRVAIVGPNGSGKTTLLAMIPRLFDPAEGAVRIDGVDLRDVSVRSLRAQIGVVPQETVLFRGTIRSNIAYGAEHATGERVGAAARLARASEFIETLPQGYDTPVGDQGLTLSGGQRQRIAIARAVLRNPSILILDEATSMVDADSEAKIAQAMEEFSAGRTTLVVAHRLSTVVNADSIIVMDQGRIVDQGRHDELLARCAVYRQIARTQLLRARESSSADPPAAAIDPTPSQSPHPPADNRPSGDEPPSVAGRINIA